MSHQSLPPLRFDYGGMIHCYRPNNVYKEAGTNGSGKSNFFHDHFSLVIMTSKTDVMNLLESAGFSRSNPYYVVQQGKIAFLTLMKDSERLELLKEIGGTHVYEDKHQKSLKILRETGSFIFPCFQGFFFPCVKLICSFLLAANSKKQIDLVSNYLEERLRELDEGKEELMKYQQLDKQRRSIEYNILDHELNEASNELASVDYLFLVVFHHD
ncbi:hypothetical protein EJB05_29132, partial [Eragrostis curvula]